MSAHEPCEECGYVIQHDEECPCCARKELDAEIERLKTELSAWQADTQTLEQLNISLGAQLTELREAAGRAASTFGENEVVWQIRAALANTAAPDVREK